MSGALEGKPSQAPFFVFLIILVSEQEYMHTLNSKRTEGQVVRTVNSRLQFAEPIAAAESALLTHKHETLSRPHVAFFFNFLNTFVNLLVYMNMSIIFKSSF